MLLVPAITILIPSQYELATNPPDRQGNFCLTEWNGVGFFSAIRRKMLCYIMQFKEIYAGKICMRLKSGSNDSILADRIQIEYFFF